MIQFLGLAFSGDEVKIASLSRDLRVGVRASSRVANIRRDESGGGFTVVPAEWVRAAGFALGEAYVDMPPKERKIWGLGLAGPAGWIALDHDFEPLSDLRVLPPEAVLDDFAAWLEAHSKFRNRIATVLSPKDYFRFVISRGLAADVTTASAMHACSSTLCDWDLEAVSASSLERAWLPPIFESTVATGRLDEEGMRQTGLPGSIWVVAGALPHACRSVDAGDLARGVLWTPAGDDSPTLGLGDTPFGSQSTPAPPEGWQLVRSPITGHAQLVRGARADGADARRELEESGHSVESVIDDDGEAEIGVAAIAAVGSGLVRSWSWFYQRRHKRDVI